MKKKSKFPEGTVIKDSLTGFELIKLKTGQWTYVGEMPRFFITDDKIGEDKRYKWVNTQSS